MLDITLTDEQRALRDTVRAMTKRYDRKYWLECAREHRYPEELWREMSRIGLLGIGVPESMGGVGMTTFELALVGEELYHAGLLVSSWQHTTFSRASILRYGTEEQKQRIVPGTTEGKIRISMAVTEPDAGSNTFRVRTFAEADGDGWVLRGQKIFIGGADIADYLLVIARNEPYERAVDKRKGLTLFLLDAKSPGIRMTPMETVLPDVVKRFSIFFDEVAVPRTALIGEEGEGMRYLFANLNVERILAAIGICGIGMLALEKGVAYARERVVFNGPIGAYQGIQHPFARAYARLEAARFMCYAAARAYDAGDADLKNVAAQANIAKLLASEAAFDAVDAAIQAYGGHAFLPENDLFNLFAQIRLTRIAPLNNEMCLNYIGEKILGLPRSY